MIKQEIKQLVLKSTMLILELVLNYTICSTRKKIVLEFHTEHCVV